MCKNRRQKNLELKHFLVAAPQQNITNVIQNRYRINVVLVEHLSTYAFVHKMQLSIQVSCSCQLSVILFKNG